MLYISHIFPYAFKTVAMINQKVVFFFSPWIIFLQLQKYLLIFHYLADYLQKQNQKKKKNKEYKIEEVTEGIVLLSNYLYSAWEVEY